jgi:gliding motility-associated protein GldL
MANKSFKENFYGNIMPKIYGLGAAVVIVGAMFKLEGWAGATPMLILGLSTEALIFAFSAFEPKQKDLAEIMERSFPQKPEVKNTQGDKVDLKKMLSDAKITGEDFKNLGAGMNSLSNSAKGLADLSNAAVASSTYADNAKKASATLTKMNESYANTAAALGEMAKNAKGAGEFQGQLKTAVGQYQEQLKSASTQLAALNNVYKEELNDSQAHVKAIKSFYANIDTALAGVGAATKEAEEFKGVMAKLNSNVNSLNKVYGAMLSAMKSN